MLKDHYAAWSTYLGRYISVDEARGMQAAKARVDELGSRLELEEKQQIKRLIRDRLADHQVLSAIH
jgi:hypothetical protein